MLNTNVWNLFVTEDLKRFGSTAIGSPDLEMFIASWNDVYPNEMISQLILSKEGCRYSPQNSILSLSTSSGKSNKLYFPGYKKDKYDGSSLLLSSPVASKKDQTIGASTGLVVVGIIGTTRRAG